MIYTMREKGRTGLTVAPPPLLFSFTTNMVVCPQVREHFNHFVTPALNATDVYFLIVFHNQMLFSYFFFV